MSETVVANILERWGMPLVGSPEGADPWYMDWVLKHPDSISRSITAGWYAYSAVREVYPEGEIQSAFEYFGGIGAQSLIIQELFSPFSHVVCDYQADSVQHMQRVLPSPIWAAQQDAYAKDLVVPDADLVGLDFGDLTAWRLRPGEKQRALCDKVFALQPKAVVLTDIAGPRLGLQRERYESWLGKGTCASYPVYLDAVSRLLEETYGYAVTGGFYYHKVAKLALVPTPLANRTSEGLPLIRPIPEGPRGLELI